MPIHEYDCPKCRETFAVILKSRETHVKCPRCGSSDVKKKLSSFSCGPSFCGGSSSGSSGFGGG